MWATRGNNSDSSLGNRTNLERIAPWQESVVFAPPEAVNVLQLTWPSFPSGGDGIAATVAVSSGRAFRQARDKMAGQTEAAEARDTKQKTMITASTIPCPRRLPRSRVCVVFRVFRVATAHPQTEDASCWTDVVPCRWRPELTRIRHQTSLGHGRAWVDWWAWHDPNPGRVEVNTSPATVRIIPHMDACNHRHIEITDCISVT